MKTIIKSSLLLGAVAIGMVSCGENSWNDKYLKGFEGGPDLSNKQSLEYTLTPNDYKNLAENSSNKSLAEAAGVSNALEAVGSLGYFDSKISPAEYIANYLSDPDFTYFTLSDGSSIKVTYKIAENYPEEMLNIINARKWSLSSEDYQDVYGSKTDYANAFSPSHTAADNLPGMLKAKYPNAVSGDFVMVNYASSDYDPNFGGSGTSGPGDPITPDDPDVFEESDVLGNISLNQEITVKGLVTGICKQGYMLADKGGAILVYMGGSYNTSTYSIGDQLEVTGSVSSFNKGFQLPASSTVKKFGHSEVIYPEPEIVTGVDMDEAILRSNDGYAEYVQFTGRLTIDGNHYNVAVDGATTAIGSLYQFPTTLFPSLESDKDYTFTGYFTSISSGKFYNLFTTEIIPAGSTKAPRKVANVAAEAYTVAYKYDGSTWSVPTDVMVLQDSDYTEELGLNYTNFSGDQPEQCIPYLLAKKYPFASKDTKYYIVYNYYASSSTTLRCEEYTYDGSEWVNSVTNDGIIYQTSQFVRRDGLWREDPSVSLVLPAGKSKPTSTWFYQAVVDWVRDNVADASYYCDSYGTAEYYSGCSAYQGNVNINAGYNQITNRYPETEGWTTELIESTMKKRFEEETAPGALSVLYPDLAPVGGLEPTVTIEFTAWCTGGVNKVYTIIFKCIEKGKFEFVSCTWND